MPTATFQSPTDYQAELASIDRQRRMADMLQQESMQPLGTQSINGWAIPNSPMAYAGKLAQGLVGAMNQGNLDARQKQLAEQFRIASQTHTQQSLDASAGDRAKFTALEMNNPDPQRAAMARTLMVDLMKPRTIGPNALDTGTGQINAYEPSKVIPQGGALIPPVRPGQNIAPTVPATATPAPAVIQNPAPQQAAPSSPVGMPPGTIVNPPKPEAPHNRTVIKGDQEQQQEFDFATRTWKDIPGATGPRFSRQVVSVNTGDHPAYTNVQPDGSGGFIGLSRATGQMEKIKNQEGLNVTGAALTPEARSQAASRYRIDGTLPTNLGRGTQGAANTAAILNEAAKQATEEGQSGEAARIQQIAGKASSTALAQLQKQQSVVEAFKNTAIRNADIVLDTSSKVDRLGSPAIDRWLQAGRKSLFGDVEVARLDAAVRTFVNEYARVTTTVTGGGITSDTARNEVETLLKGAHTKEQVKGVINLMKQEMDNRSQGYAQEINRIKGTFGGSQNMSSQNVTLDAALERYK